MESGGGGCDFGSDGDAAAGQDGDGGDGERGHARNGIGSFVKSEMISN